MKTIKDKLAYQLNKNDIRPHTLSKTAEVSESSIKNILYGKSLKPNIGLVESLAKILNCGIDELLSDDDPRITNKQTKDYDAWNGNLYIAALQAVMAIAEKKGLILSRQEANLYAKRIYKYAIVNEETTVDMKFANYILS